MIKANYTLFKFYLAEMDFYLRHLSLKKYERSLNNCEYYKVIIIQKIVRLFHSLELLALKIGDEVSARCLLRGILDSVANYCFIYQRHDSDDIMFRHYLYLLDGWRAYKKSVMVIIEANEDRQNSEFVCDHVISNIEDRLRHHPYYLQKPSTAKFLIQKANWRFKSLQHPVALNYRELYLQLGLNPALTEYYQGYLSQFVHGLYMSNNDTNLKLKRVLYESIPVAVIFIKAIALTFNNKELVTLFHRSEECQNFLNSKDVNYDDLLEITTALIRKDKTLLI